VARLERKLISVVQSKDAFMSNSWSNDQMTLRKLATTASTTALLCVAALCVSSSSAGARTVCNNNGDCWHESTQYDYPASLGFRFYGDDYRTTHHDHERTGDTNHDQTNAADRDHNYYNWRDNHDGRGYYQNGIWVTF
jgi:hypothetical protein